MRVLRIIGWIFLVLSVLSVALGVWLWFAGHDMTQPAGQLWFALDSQSLNTAQVVVQRYLYADLWDVVIVPVLQRATWLAVAVVAVFFAILGGPILLLARRRRHRSFRL